MTEAPKKSWQESRQRRHITTSASQHETFDLCARKWWLEKVRRLEVPQTTSNTFGTVLHGVVERFLRGDDLGRDEQGRPVDLYPPGWTRAVSKYTGEIEGEVTPAEQDQIRSLVAAAIDEGVLERLPGRRIEHEFRKSVVVLSCVDCKGEGFVPVAEGNHFRKRCETCDGSGRGTNVEIVGFVDAFYRDRIEDHKSTKAMKWAKSANALKTNRQMLIYAKVALDEVRERGEPLPPHFMLRHNVFCKSPTDKRVRKTETFVTPEQIEQAWSEVVENARWMDHYRRVCNTWSDLPEPRTGSQACNAYGGCPFMYICAGQESEKGYEERLARHTQKGYSTPAVITVHGKNTSAGVQEMASFEQQIAAAKGGNPHAQPGTVNPPAPQQAPAQPTPQAAPAPAQPGPPPWGTPGCGACGGNGFNTKGNPCQICDYQTVQRGGPASGAFNVQSVGNGYMHWSAKDGSGWQGYSPLPSAGQPVQVQERTQEPPPPTQPQAAFQPPPQPQQWPSPQMAPQPQMQPQMAPPPQQWQPPAQQPPAQQAPQGYMSPAVQQAAPQAPQQATPTTSTTEEGDDETEVSGKRAKGRPPKGFTVCINCGPIRGTTSKGDRSAVALDQLLLAAGAEMAAQAGVGSFYDLDPFKRRDALMRAGDAIAKNIGTSMVIAVGVGSGQSDLKAMLDAILPYAGMVIIGEH